MKRIGIAQIWQETNSFNPVLTTTQDFKRWDLAEGNEVLEKFGEIDEIGGFLSGLKAAPMSFEPMGLLRAVAWPGGALSKETLRWLISIIQEKIGKVGKLDGLLFSLHGALAAEKETDVDGCLLETAREVLGRNVAPVVATVDCHAHITGRMMRHADAVVAYHSNPHTDRFQTGERAARVLSNTVEGAKPKSASVRLPMITVGEVQNTTGEVLGPILERLYELETKREILSAAVLMTQPWLDAPHLGWSTLVTTDNRPELAQELAAELAEMCWVRRLQLRGEFTELCSAEEAVATALKCTGKPVVVSDGPDATNSGAPGDSTHLLRSMIDRKIPGGALTIMVDPEAVAHAKSVGCGGKFEFAVGGKRDRVFCQPLKITGEVISLQAARYVLSGHLSNRLPVDMGLSATVSAGDVTLLLVEYPGPGSSPMMYRCVGLEPKDFKIVVVKSPAGFRAEFEPFAADIILTDSPGCASPHFEKLPFGKINRPLWPIDEITTWRDVEWLRTG